MLESKRVVLFKDFNFGKFVLFFLFKELFDTLWILYGLEGVSFREVYEVRVVIEGIVSEGLFKSYFICVLLRVVFEL